jgi:hypothetical protein
MLLSIPYQALEVGNIHLNPFQSDKYGKSIARLSYKDNSIDFHDVSILSPALKVIDYNPENSRLRLDLSEQFNFQVKLSTLQEYLVSTFFIHQQSFLGHQFINQDIIRNCFHFLIEGTVLSLYIYPTTIIKKSDGTVFKITELLPGDSIRCIIRFQGISQIRTKYGIRLRLQHTVPSLWFLENSASSPTSK